MIHSTENVCLDLAIQKSAETSLCSMQNREGQRAEEESNILSCPGLAGGANSFNGLPNVSQ